MTALMDRGVKQRHVYLMTALKLVRSARGIALARVMEIAPRVRAVMLRQGYASSSSVSTALTAR